MWRPPPPELATNLLVHAGGGRFEVRVLPGRPGIELQAIDYGPGIADLEQAMQKDSARPAAWAAACRG